MCKAKTIFISYQIGMICSLLIYYTTGSTLETYTIGQNRFEDTSVVKLIRSRQICMVFISGEISLTKQSFHVLFLVDYVHFVQCDKFSSRRRHFLNANVRKGGDSHKTTEYQATEI